jgi:hypothetical protein
MDALTRTRTRTRITRGVLAVAVIGTICGGIAGAGTVSTANRHHRAVVAARRAAEAAAAAKAADDKAKAAYAQSVQKVAGDVVASLQPVERVLARLNAPKPGVITVVQDVLVRAGTSAQLATAVSALDAVHAPASIGTDAADLTDKAHFLRDSYSSLVGSVEHASGVGLVDVLTGSKLDVVRGAELQWHHQLSKVFADLNADTPAAPGEDGGWNGPGSVGTVATKASWIAGADSACATAMQAFTEPDVDHLDVYVRQQRAQGAAIAVMDRTIRSLPRPADDADTLRTTVVSHLAANDAYGRLMTKLGSDVAERNLSAYDADIHSVAAAFALVAPLQRGLSSYGATLCGHFLRPLTSSSHSGGTAPAGSAGTA